MSSTTTTEAIRGHVLGPRPTNPVIGPSGAPSEARPDALAQSAHQMADEDEYFDDLERDIPGVESDFWKATNSQTALQAKKGRVAVLRMAYSGPQPPHGDIRQNLTPRWIKWRKPGASVPGSPELPEGLIFEDLDRFKEALEILPRHHDKSAVPQFFEKQLIVMEDLGRDWVGTVGSVFHVPPRVFALQWASPSLYKLGRARVPLGQPAEEHFVLPYSEILPFEIKEGRDYFKLDCSSVRFVSSDMQQDQEVDQGDHQGMEVTNTICEAMVSYWGGLGSREEWTAILLVDPQPEAAQSGRSGAYKIVRADADGKTLGDLPFQRSRAQSAQHPDPRPALRSLHDEFRWRPVILKASRDEKSESTVWTLLDLGIQNSGMPGREPHQLPTIQTRELLDGVAKPFKVAPHRNILRAVPHTWSLSMFDQILRAPPSSPIFHPAHATKLVRRIVLAKMTLIVDIYLRQTYSLTVKAMQNISKIADFDPQRLSEKPWQDEWRSEFFNKLWELRGNIELLGFDMENIIRVFSVLSDNTSWPEMQNFETAAAEKWNKDKCFEYIKIRDQDLEDLKAWEDLEATRKYAAGFIERTTNSYLQAATAEGAKFANVQAKTSKKITFLATLFVPASLCAAVLALPGYAGAQGTARFWLFWAVSVPIAAVLAFTLLFKDIRAYIKEKRKKVKHKNEARRERKDGTDTAKKSLAQFLSAQDLEQGLELVRPRAGGRYSQRLRTLSQQVINLPPV